VPGGYLQIATDWPDYAEHIQAVLATNPALTSLSAASDASAMDIAMHPALPTKYERRGRKLGHHIHQFRYRKD
jgi:tRNA (guanine-N7-)-methyltransferase